MSFLHVTRSKVIQVWFALMLWPSDNASTLAEAIRDAKAR